MENFNVRFSYKHTQRLWYAYIDEPITAQAREKTPTAALSRLMQELATSYLNSCTAKKEGPG